MSAFKRNEKISPSEMIRLRNQWPATQSLAQELTNLNLMGVYGDDPDPESRSLWRAAHQQWGAEKELRVWERRWGMKVVAGGGPAPTFADLTGEQVDEAEAQMTVDFATLPRVPWSSLHRAVGHGFLPEAFWSIAADSGHGKTTWVMSLAEGWLREKRRVFGLPLEQGVDTTRRYLAALATGLRVKSVLKNDWAMLPSDAQELIKDHLAWQRAEGAKLLYLHRHGRVGAREFPALYKQAADFGAEIFFIDHIHRVRVRDHNEYADLCASIKELAKVHKIPCVATAQNHRGEGQQDRLRAHLLPTVDRIQGGKVLEQECDEVLGVYRPLKDGLDKETLSALRQGFLMLRDYLKPFVVGVAILKARIEGVTGDVVELRWDKGRIVDPEDEAAKTTEERYEL